MCEAMEKSRAISKEDYELGQKNFWREVDRKAELRARLRRQIYVFAGITFVLLGDSEPGIDWFVNISGSHAWWAIFFVHLYLWASWASLRGDRDGSISLSQFNDPHRPWLGIPLLLTAIRNWFWPSKKQLNRDRMDITPNAGADEAERHARSKMLTTRSNARHDVLYFLVNWFPEWVLLAAIGVTIYCLRATYTVADKAGMYFLPLP